MPYTETEFDYLIFGPLEANPKIPEPNFGFLAAARRENRLSKLGLKLIENFTYQFDGRDYTFLLLSNAKKKL